MGPDHSAIVVGRAAGQDAARPRETYQVYQTLEESAAGIRAMAGGTNINIARPSGNSRPTQTTTQRGVGGGIRNEVNDIANTTLGRRVLASAAAGRAAAQAQLGAEAARTSGRARRMSFDYQNTTPGTAITQGVIDEAMEDWGDMMVVPSDSDDEPSVPRRTGRVHRAATAIFPRFPSDDNSPTTTVVVPSNPPGNGEERATVRPMAVPERLPRGTIRSRRAGDVDDATVRPYLRVVDPQSSTASYHVRRQVNADGDEYVHRIPAEGWMNPEFSESYDGWARAVEQERQTEQYIISLRRRMNQIREQAQPIAPPPLQPLNSRREIPAPLGARPAPPPRMNSLHRWWRDRQDGRLNMDGDDIMRDYEDELRRDIEEMDRNFDNAVRTGGTRLEFVPPVRRRIFREADNGRGGQRGNTSTADTLPLGLREQLADETPYYLYPLPQPLDQSRNLGMRKRRIAAPATTFSELAAR